MIEDGRFVEFSIILLIMGSSKSKQKAQQQAPQVKSVEAPYIMKIQYCGGWGYEKYSNNVQREVELMSPGKFKFEPFKDKGVTGRFEITICKKDNLEQSQLVHSKLQG